MEDVITDSVAAPDLLDRSEWLPESFKQQQAQTGLEPITHNHVLVRVVTRILDRFTIMFTVTVRHVIQIQVIDQQ